MSPWAPVGRSPPGGRANRRRGPGASGRLERRLRFLLLARSSLTELAGPTLGVVGLGMACDGTMPVVPLKELLERSELVSLHCPLPPRTLGQIDGGRLATIKARRPADHHRKRPAGGGGRSGRRGRQCRRESGRRPSVRSHLSPDWGSSRTECPAGAHPPRCSAVVVAKQQLLGPTTLHWNALMGCPPKSPRKSPRKTHLPQLPVSQQVKEAIIRILRPWRKNRQGSLALVG